LAESSLDEVIAHTNDAISKTTVIQNSWNSMVSGLTDIEAKINACLTTGDNDQKLKNAIVVNYFMTKAQEQWNKIRPTIDTMVNNPYITVSPDAQTLGDFGKEVVAETHKLEAKSAA